MLQTLLGREVFRQGFDEYIRTNDGHAVTCEAFLEAMSKASGRDLSQFRRLVFTGRYAPRRCAQPLG